MDKLSDLEAAAIGDILQNEPCTAHFVRTCFRDSPAKHFSDSAGSVYPMVKRLVKRGYIESYQQTEGRREVNYLRVTTAGRKALQVWIGPPIATSAVLTIDPLRTRMVYLYRISKAKRKLWFEKVEAQLRDKLADIIKLQSAHPPESSDYLFAVLADENAIMELKTRLKWLEKTKARLAEAGFLDA